jgi:hypothetical protein
MELLKTTNLFLLTTENAETTEEIFIIIKILFNITIGVGDKNF